MHKDVQCCYPHDSQTRLPQQRVNQDSDSWILEVS